jgi:hypothetical protein
MYGVSLTSGQPVTIVQKFPDLLQQVVFEASTNFLRREQFDIHIFKNELIILCVLGLRKFRM